MANFCTNCGKPLEPGAKFCTECGFKIMEPKSSAGFGVNKGVSAAANAHSAAADMAGRAAMNIAETVAGEFGAPAAAAVKEGTKRIKKGGIAVSAILLIGVWIAQIALMRMNIENPMTRILNFATYARGGMDRGIAGLLGGTIGRGVFASAFVTLLGGGAGMVAAGFRNVFSGKRASEGLESEGKGSFFLALLGAVLAIVLYWIFNGNLKLSGIMAGVAGILVAARSLGSRAGGLYRFASKLSPIKSEGGKLPNPAGAKSLLTGLMTGFTLSVAAAAGAAGLSAAGLSAPGPLDDLIPGLIQQDKEEPEKEEEPSEEPEKDQGPAVSEEDLAGPAESEEAKATEEAEDKEKDAPAQESEKPADAMDFLLGESESAPPSGEGEASSEDYSQGLDGYTPATYSVTGGEWTTLQSGEKIYTLADGAETMNVWVEDKDKYYYVDYSGCLMRSNYAQDGYWAGEDGSWDQSKPRRTDDTQPVSGAEYGTDPKVTVEILNYSDDSHYAIATRRYSFGYEEEFNVLPLGNSTYLLEGKNDFNSGLLMSVSEDQSTLIISGAGTTEVYRK